MAKKKTKTTTRAIKKKWFTLVAPEFLNSKVIGETPLVEHKMILGKTIIKVCLIRDLLFPKIVLFPSILVASVRN